MKRRQWFELEDLQRFPIRIRNYMTDYLGFVANRFRLYDGIAERLAEALRRSGETTIVDLASGGGGGLPVLVQSLQAAVPGLKVVFSDWYPNLPAFEEAARRCPGQATWDRRSIDARAVPPDLIGFRTQFLSFHHFAPADARRILQNAVDARMPIAVVEAQRRDLGHLIRFAFSPLFVLLLTPFIRPITVGRIFFTYFLPIVPLCVFWDGLVSVLRTYSVEEMKAMTASLEDTALYQWDIGESTQNQITVLYLIGIPVLE